MGRGGDGKGRIWEGEWEEVEGGGKTWSETV